MENEGVQQWLKSEICNFIFVNKITFGSLNYVL